MAFAGTAGHVDFIMKLKDLWKFSKLYQKELPPVTSRESRVYVKNLFSWTENKVELTMFNALDAFLSTSQPILPPCGANPPEQRLAVNLWAISPKFDASQPRILCILVVSGHRKSLDPHGGTTLQKIGCKSLGMSPWRKAARVKLQIETRAYRFDPWWIDRAVETHFESEPEISVGITLWQTNIAMENHHF